MGAITTDDRGVDINVAKVQRFCDQKIPPHVRDQLLWANRNGRWLKVPDAPATPHIDDLLRVVEENRSGAFD